MIDRPKQKITSPFGKRWGVMHNGVDLRNWDDSFQHRLPVILPEGCIFKRRVFQEKWGWTFVFTPLTSGRYELKFIHMAGNDKLVVGETYDKGSKIGYNALTPYMISKKLGEHLHFEVHKGLDDPEDPVIYYKELGIEFE